MTVVERPSGAAGGHAPAGDPDRSGDSRDRERGRVTALVGGALLVVVVFAGQAPALPPGALTDDLGIQYALGQQTAAGALPLRDFEHTWNVLSWWFNGALHRLVGGDPSAWLFLWSRVFGPMLAGLAVVAIAWRLRLRAVWVVATVGTWLALTNVLHAKYAIPTLWVLAALPVGRWAHGRSAIVVRAALGAITFWAHVELAVLLGAGLVLFDLLAVDSTVPWRDRARTALATPAGVLAGFGVQCAGYAMVGVGPGDLVRQLVWNAGQTVEGFNWRYPLFAPPSFRPKVFPVSVIVAFVPWVWRRLAPTTRMVACLHLGQAIIALRRPDPTHVDAAVTLLGLLVVLVAHDLLEGRGVARSAGAPAGRRAVAAASGGVWVAAALVGGFAVPSFASIVLLTAVVVLGVVVAARHEAPWASAGALAALGSVLAVGTAGGVVATVRSGDDDSSGRAVAAAVAEPLRRCSGGADAAWVVPGPLTLYDHLGIRNATPYAVFWYGFRAEHDRVRTLVGDGDIPAVLRIGGWPPSFEGLDEDLDRAFEVCERVEVPATGDVVEVLVPAP